MQEAIKVYEKIGKLIHTSDSIQRARVKTALDLVQENQVDAARAVVNLVDELNKAQSKLEELQHKYNLLRQLAKEEIAGARESFDEYTNGQSFVTDDGYPLDGLSDAAYEDYREYRAAIAALKEELGGKSYIVDVDHGVILTGNMKVGVFHIDPEHSSVGYSTCKPAYVFSTEAEARQYLQERS